MESQKLERDQMNTKTSEDLKESGVKLDRKDFVKKVKASRRLQKE